MQIFTARQVFDGEKLLQNIAISVDNGVIVGLTNVDHVDKKNINYLGDGILSPGLVDLQLNGCGGVSFNQAINFDTLEIMHQTCLGFGTTSFLPTLITSDFSNVEQSLKVVKQWFDKFGSKRGVIGLHLEGPFISENRNGIHPKPYILQPQLELLQPIIEHANYFPIKMTIAIEKFNQEQLNLLNSHGIILALGHSAATYDEAISGITTHQIKTATHVFNATGNLSARDPGVLGAVLNSKVYNGVIADLVHVHPANLEILCKLKPQYTYLVTDSVAPTGTSIDKFEFAAKTLYIKNGKCVDAEGTLGGSLLTMNQAVMNCVDSCAIAVEQALRMATTIPAKVMSLDGQIGRIAIGYPANLTYIEPNTFNCSMIPL